MTVEQHDVVDIIGIDKEGRVTLTVSDHLEWTDSVEHQETLQTKLNKYLAFVESGEILEKYPTAKDKPVLFDVVFRHKPDNEGRLFLERAREIVKSAGFDLEWQVFAESYDN